MNVGQLRDFIVSEIIKGNLTENSKIKFQSYMNSEWGMVKIDANFAKSVDKVLVLSDAEMN